MGAVGCDFRHCDHRPGLLPSLLEGEAFWRFVDADCNHTHGFIGEDAVLDRLLVAEDAGRAVARANESADPEIDVGKSGAQKFVAPAGAPYLPQFRDRSADRCLIDEGWRFALLGTSGLRGNQEIARQDCEE